MANSKKLTKPFFADQNILIIGDVMIDRYLNGQVNRISPEAPVPVVDFKSSVDRLGGAANVALNIKMLGATPILISITGNDLDGAAFGQLLVDHDLSNTGIIQVANRPTTVKTRVMAASQHLLRIDREVRTEINNATEDILLAKIEKTLTEQKIGVLLFQDYNKGILTKRLIRRSITLAEKFKVPCVVDPKFIHFFDYKKITLFKPNLKEVQQCVPFVVTPDLASLTKAAEYLENKLGNPYTMITLSEKGIFIKNNKQAQIIPTSPRMIADVCGAGDAVISVAALGVAKGMKLAEIAQLANIAGGQVCERVGVVPVEIKALLEEWR